MTELKNLQIFIIDNSNYMASCLLNAFKGVPNVTVKHYDLGRFFDENKDKIDCLVSPANAFGCMTGGYDAALSNILGWDFQGEVQEYIKNNFYGEQGVGTSFILKTHLPNLSLIHTPTMQYPSLIKDEMIVYYCMRSTLICALKNNIKCIVIPVFGGACGGVDGEKAGNMMRKAYDQILYRIGPNYDI